MPSALENLVQNMTLAELAERSGRTVEAIASYALRGSGGPSHDLATSVPGRRGKQAASRRDRKQQRSASDEGGTERRSGRQTFDERLLAAIRSLGGKATSRAVEGIVGGTAAERRTALARLVESKKLTRSGTTRGTTYAVR